MCRAAAVFIIVICVLTVFAEDGAAKVAVGMKWGIGIASQEFGGSGSYRQTPQLWRWGFSLGVIVESKRSERVSWRQEILYIQKGTRRARSEYDDALYHWEVNVYDQSVDYISAAVMARIRVLTHRGATAYLLVGPRADWKVGAHVEPWLWPDPEALNSVTFGGSFGIGCEIPTHSSSSLVLEILCQPDFTSAYDLKSYSIRNRTVLMSIGLLL